MFKIINHCPLCKSTNKSKIIKNNKNIYSYFLSKIMKLKESFILKNMKNYKCVKCGLIYKKKWLYSKHIRKIYKNYQITHPGGLNCLKKNFGKTKFIKLFQEYINFYNEKNYFLSERRKREIIKILQYTDNDEKIFIRLKNKFIKKLYTKDHKYVKKNYLNLYSYIKKPKLYSQFSGFKSKEITKYLNKNINLKNIKSYAEVGCPLWGNYDYFKKPWIKRYFININEENFWKADKTIDENCLRYLPKKIKVINKKPFKKVDFIGIYSFLDHVEQPLELFNKNFKNVNIFGIICEDINFSKKIDCQHFSSWNYKSIKFLSKKISFNIHTKPLRLGNSIFKLYILKKILT